MRAFASGWTALIGASTDGHAQAVTHLLDKGADVNAANNNEGTPLQGRMGGRTMRMGAYKGAYTPIGHTHTHPRLHAAYS
eukprot:6531601-Pyramimonas_sp.AAC.1